MSKFALKKLETPLSDMAQSIFRFLEPFRNDLYECDGQRDHRTDIIIVNAALNYVARQKLNSMQHE